ncbi:MAG: hypothetical protein AUG84_00405 [Chloroflexi bacterium 13_1_20CM_4_66_7]|nr:MAG: hypothetical protein AUG84_00405 [Chloroflexi bacterium 13_1_20CM_4_66_7]
MYRMPQARDDALGSPVRIDDLARDLLQVACRGRLLQSPGRLLDRAAEPIPHAQQAGCDRRLQRFGGAKVRQPGGDRAWREAMLDQRHDEGVEHDRFLRRREAVFELQEGDIAERDLADQLLGEVVAADEDLVCCAVAEARLDARLAAHFCTVSLVL